ncbi:MAG: HAD family hydrolase [Candidatus Bathyarchaeota archaeon]|nr:HAD family hydrolase [Candidatus Bathyarchaeota archaeon]
MLHGIRLIIYDLDGTLIDSMEAIVETFNRVVEEQGGEACQAEAIKEMIGLPLTEMFRRVLPEEKHDRLQACWDRFIEIYADVGPAKTHILPGVEETLKHFKQAGYLQSVATTKRGDVATRLLGALGLRGYFDLILGINDVPAPKPAPDIINLTLERLRVKPGEAVFVEDTTIGLEAGKKAGVYTVGVTTGTHDMQKLATMRPDCILNNLQELTRLVAR